MNPTFETLNLTTEPTLTIAQGIDQTATAITPTIPAPPCAEGEIETAGEAGGSNA